MKLTDFQIEVVNGIIQGQVISFKTFILQFCTEETPSSYNSQTEGAVYIPCCRNGFEEKLQEKLIEYRELIKYLTANNLINPIDIQQLESDSIFTIGLENCLFNEEWHKYYKDSITKQYTSSPQLKEFVNNSYKIPLSFKEKLEILSVIILILTMLITIKDCH